MADITMGRIIQINIQGRLIDCDIRLPLTTKMSDNFTLAEMVDPTTNKLILCPMLLEIMQKARTSSGCSIVVTNGLSWFREYEYNKKIGGSPTSYHLQGSACDSKWYYRSNQIHPIHTAYIMEQLSLSYGIKYEIGVYLPKYDGNSTGYMHYAVAPVTHLYYYSSGSVKHEITNLKDIAI